MLLKCMLCSKSQPIQDEYTRQLSFERETCFVLSAIFILTFYTSSSSRMFIAMVAHTCRATDSQLIIVNCIKTNIRNSDNASWHWPWMLFTNVQYTNGCEYKPYTLYVYSLVGDLLVNSLSHTSGLHACSDLL